MSDAMTLMLWLHLVIIILQIVQLFSGTQRSQALALVLRYLPSIIAILEGKTPPDPPPDPPNTP